MAGTGDSMQRYRILMIPLLTRVRVTTAGKLVLYSAGEQSGT